MKRLKLGFWLLAWSCWLWLGFGLHRELPRSLGPRICHLRLKENEGVLGFLEGIHEFVTWASQGKFKPHLIRIWNAETGAMIRQLDGPLDTGGFNDLSFRREHGLVIGDRRPGEEGRASSVAPAASVLDLLTGRWVDLPAGCDRSRGFHPSKAWAWFQDEAKRPKSEETSTVVKVVDLGTGSVLFGWSVFDHCEDGFRLYSKPVFVDESLIAIPIRKATDVGEVLEERLQVWSIPSGTGPVKEFRAVTVGDDPVSSETGRIAWHLDSNDPWIDVFDVHKERLVFSYPPKRERWIGGSSGHDYGLVLGHDGKSVYRHHLNKLFEVDSGRLLWELHEEATLGPLAKGETLRSLYWAGPMEVREEWSLKFGDFPPLCTFAIRNFTDGRIRYRYIDASDDPRELSSDGTLLYIGQDNGIYRAPPPPNLPLLALCQTIVALPLVMLWAVLRWRRRRAARRRPAEAAL